MRQLFAAFLFLAVSALLQGCGQTGPLYMPDQPPADEDSEAAGYSPTPSN
ncbi:lipoprotein [Parahaliea maris]|uniref:Lipoprotein n=1 Tax=Parahaliea maris TaxID=2716870 RepID=A0A5C9A2R6_9GAMM|nr:lipoprotein [Parahaliea maris]TXS94242.1 lipoprotein [Parahaliea maris]